MTDQEEKLKLPKISFYQLVQARRKAISTMRRFSGQRMDGGEDQKNMSSALYHVFQLKPSAKEVEVRHKGKLIKEKATVLGTDVIENSLNTAVNSTISSVCAGEVLDAKLMHKLAYVIAGNLTTLRLGDSLVPWVSQPYPEWALIIVMGAHRTFTPKRKIPGGTLRMHVMCGQAAGETFEQFFTDRSLQRMARFIGLRGKREYERVHPFEFGQLKFLGRLKAGEELFIEEYREQGALNARNRKLVKKRGEDRICPHNFMFPCSDCHYGFVDCPLGTHQYTFQRRDCPMCSRKGFFDQTDMEQKVCLQCQMLKWRSV